MNWILTGFHIVPEALHTDITTNAYSGRVTHGKGSIEAIQGITSCRTVESSVSLRQPVLKSFVTLTIL